MPHSEILDGQVLDWKFKKMVESDGYVFYVGDILIGQIFGPTIGRKWSAVSVEYCEQCPVNGFATRDDAAEYLLSVFRSTHDIKSKLFEMKDEASVSYSGDFWYDITDGGYIKPIECLRNSKDVAQVEHSIKVLQKFIKSIYQNNMLIEL